MRGTRLLSFLAASALALPLAACGSDEGSGGPDDPYIIMISGGSEAGPLTDQLRTAVLSARAAVKLVNEAGGIDGRQVKLIESPDQADPTKAVTNLRSQIAKDAPDAYLSTPSSIASAVAPILKQSNILFMNGGNVPETNDPDGNPLAFNLAAPFATTVESFLPAIEEAGADKVGILYGNNPYSVTFGETAAETLEEQGYDVVSEEYDSTALDMTAQISALQSEDPDVLVFNGYGPPVGYVLDGIQKLGWDVPILGDVAVTGTPLVTQNPPDGLLGTDAVATMQIQIARSMDRAQQSEATEQGAALIREEGDIPTSFTSCLPYDGIILIQAAAEAAGSSDPEDIAEALENLDKDPGTIVFTSYNFTSDSHEATLPEGELTFVPPAEMVDGQLG